MSVVLPLCTLAFTRWLSSAFLSWTAVTVAGQPCASGTACATIPPLPTAAGSRRRVNVTVTARDGVTATTYSVTIVRVGPPPPFPGVVAPPQPHAPLPATMADVVLSELRVSGAVLTPNFEPLTLSYATEVPFGMSMVAISYVPANPSSAVVSVRGPVTLMEGLNIYQIRVVSADKMSSAAYTVSVLRRSPQAAKQLAALSVVAHVRRGDATTASLPGGGDGSSAAAAPAGGTMISSSPVALVPHFEPLTRRAWIEAAIEP